MKLLYASVLGDTTGYMSAAYGHILAMNSAGIDVVARKVSLSGANAKLPDIIEEMTKKDANDITHVLHHYLPQMFAWKGGVKNLGLFHYETTNFKPSGWQYYCNLMDAVIVNSTQNMHCCQCSRVKSPVRLINQPVDIHKFKKELPKLNLPISGKFVFYGVGDYSYRKNYRTLIRAYLNTFTKNDDVVLVLKTFVAGLNPQESVQHIVNEINEIKTTLRKHHTSMYPEIILITERLSDDEILSLHAIADCFVSVEYGAGICLPALDAMVCGNSVIAPAWGGHTDFLQNHPRSTLVEGALESCFGMDNKSCPYTDLYTSYEEWYRVDYLNLCYALQEKYRAGNKTKVVPIEYLTANHSYQSVGLEWKKLLSEI